MERSFVGYFADVPQPQRHDLTDAQVEALRYLSHGMTAPMIADVTGVCEQAVKDRLWRAKHRLAAKNTTHAVALAIRLGLIQ